MLDFGANGDGATDNMKPFQNYLHAASPGGIGNSIMINIYILIICCNMKLLQCFKLYHPDNFAFKTNTTIVIPRGVTLQGTYQ